MKKLFNLSVPLALVSVASSLLFSSVQAQPLEAQWLYLSSGGSWIAREELLLNSQSQLHLPVTQLRAEQLWWQAEDPRTQLVWQQPDPSHLPKRGSTVEIVGESGLWLIQEVSSQHLVLQQGKVIRYWPQSQWHLLQWGYAADFGLALTVLQPENKKNNLFYAWQEPALNAQVRYRLQADGKGGTLYQELIVSNLTDSEISAAGYSFAQQQQIPVVAMRTMTMAAENQMVATPQAGQSQGVPTLVNAESITLAAQSHAWIPVQQTELSSVERRYQLNWDSRQTGEQQAQTELQLTAKTQLPELAGPVKIGIFDQQLALQESYFSASQSKTTSLNLGASALVGMNAKLLAEGRWQLTVANRSAEAAEIELLINHRQANKTQRIPMTVRVKANSEQMIELETKNSEIRIAN